jgi:Domain of unknown function (DUF4333)
MLKLSALIGLGGLVALLTACGVTVGPHHTLDAASVAGEISSQLAKDYQIEGPAVTCPDGVKASKGNTFVCKTVIDNQPLELDGTVTGSNGQYQVVPRDAIIHIPLLVEYLKKDIAQRTRLAPWTVDCGTKQFAVVAVGGKITCSATSPRLPAPRKVVTTVKNKEGQVSYSLSE